MKTLHKTDCRMAFGRKDPTCDRCKELIGGAPVRKWFTPIARIYTFVKCSHYNDNAGGYCITCGSGRDFS